MAEIAIGNMIIDHVVDRLQTRLIDEVTDETQASVVRAGKLQDDPTRGNGINVLIWPSEDLNPDEIYTPERKEGILSPTYEVGGGSFYMRRFEIQMIFHFRGLRGEEGRIEARQNAQVLLSRIRHTLLSMNSSQSTSASDLPLHPVTMQPKDDFGETAIMLQIDEFYLSEGGGTGHFIWKGQIKFSFLTEHLV